MEKDKGGRRRVQDRRCYTQSGFFPERRAIRYRRSGRDRRSQLEPQPTGVINRRNMLFPKPGEAA